MRWYFLYKYLLVKYNSNGIIWKSFNFCFKNVNLKKMLNKRYWLSKVLNVFVCWSLNLELKLDIMLGISFFRDLEYVVNLKKKNKEKNVK